MPYPSEKISAKKAKKVLKHGKVKGRPLSELQEHMFGAAAGKGKKRGKKRMKKEKKVA